MGLVDESTLLDFSLNVPLFGLCEQFQFEHWFLRRLDNFLQTLYNRYDG